MKAQRHTAPYRAIRHRDIIVYLDEPELDSRVKVAIYARVSSAENRKNLDAQAERLSHYAMARGYQVVGVVKEVGSGLNDHRKKLERLLEQDDYTLLLVEQRRAKRKTETIIAQLEATGDT